MHIKVATLTTLLLSGLATAQTWESAPALPTGGAAKVWAVGANLGGTIYALGGTPWSGGGDGTVYSLDLGAVGWIEELSFDGIGPVISQGGGIDSLGRIVIFGGENTDNFDPGGTFDWDTQEGPWHDLAMRSGAAPIKFFAYCSDAAGRVYSLGGGGGEGGANTTHAERYIASSDMWELIAPMPVAAGDAAAVDDGMGHVLVIGGVSGDGTTRLTEVQQFDTTTGTWSTTAVPDLPVGVSQANAVRDVNGKIYLMGGLDGPTLGGSTRNEVLIYDPALGTWENGPSMTTPRRRFAAVLGNDDFIYAIGGDNDSGGTNTVEKMHPTDCPVFNEEPGNQSIWRGATLYLHTAVVGAQPMTLQWRQNGVDLVDGPTAHGSVISGATTDTLTLTNAQEEDLGFYVLEASNGCGTTFTTSAGIAVQVQAPMPTSWTVTSLHPGYADNSYATAVNNGVQAGHAVFDTAEYSAIDHPMLWYGSAESGLNVTPADSQGGGITAISGHTAVGWWWRPIQCYVNHQWQTCYFRRASVWDVTTGVQRFPTATGWEYHGMADTDGTLHVGSATNDDDSGNIWTHAMVWTEPNLSQIDFHPTGYSSSFLVAIDGPNQYGSVYTPYPAPRPLAGKWTGNRDSFELLHPDGAINSVISGARDGQQVGRIDQWTTPRAGLWSGSKESFMPFVAPGFSDTILLGCEGGYQFGLVIDSAGQRSAYLWRGNPGEGVDVGQIAAPTYTSSSINDMDIEPDGTVVLVGQGFNPDASRWEALLWRGTVGAQPCNEADLVEPFGVLDFFDVAEYLARFSAGDLAADLNGDGLLDFFDVSANLSAFSAGCP